MCGIVCLRVCARTCQHVGAHVCVLMRWYGFIRLCVSHVRRARAHVRAGSWACVCVCAWACTCIHKHMHTCTHAHMQMSNRTTHTHSLAWTHRSCIEYALAGKPTYYIHASMQRIHADTHATHYITVYRMHRIRRQTCIALHRITSHTQDTHATHTCSRAYAPAYNGSRAAHTQALARASSCPRASEYAHMSVFAARACKGMCVCNVP